MKYELENVSGSSLSLFGSTISAGETMVFTLSDSQLKVARNCAEIRIVLIPKAKKPTKKPTTKPEPRPRSSKGES